MTQSQYFQQKNIEKVVSIWVDYRLNVVRSHLNIKIPYSIFDHKLAQLKLVKENKPAKKRLGKILFYLDYKSIEIIWTYMVSIEIIQLDN